MRGSAQGSWRALRFAALLALDLVLVPPGRTSEPGRLLADEAAIAVAVGQERRLSIEGFGGEIEIVPSEEGDLKVAGESGGAGGRPASIALYGDEAAFRLRPSPSVGIAAPRLRVWLPKRLAAIVEGSGARVRAVSVESDLTVRGRNVQLDASAIGGSLTVDVQEGAVAVSNSGGDLAVKSRGTSLTIDGVGGTSTLHVAGAKTTIGRAQGGVEGEFDDVELKLTQHIGPCRIRLRAGRADVRGLDRGGELHLAGATLELRDSAGSVTIESDRDVQVKGVDGPLRITSFGGDVRVAEVKGTVDVTGSGAASVSMETIQGAVTVDGGGMRTEIKDAGGGITVKGATQDVVVTNATGSVEIEVDGANATVSQGVGDARIRSRGGDVLLGDLNGPVDVEADGGKVLVSWLSMPSTKDSTIKNENGSVEAVFSAGAQCRVEAKSEYGHVEATGLPRVIVQEGNGVAQGLVGRAGRPMVKITANGDIRLSGADAGDEGYR